MDLLPSADVIFRVNEDGTVIEQQRTDIPEPARGAAAESSPDEEKRDSTEDETSNKIGKSTAVPSDAAPDKLRGNGDLSLYSYFFQSVGTPLMFSWIITCMVASVIEKMPRTFGSLQTINKLRLC